MNKKQVLFLITSEYKHERKCNDKFEKNWEWKDCWGFDNRYIAVVRKEGKGISNLSDFNSLTDALKLDNLSDINIFWLRTQEIQNQCRIYINNNFRKLTKQLCNNEVEPYVLCHDKGTLWVLKNDEELKKIKSKKYSFAEKANDWEILKDLKNLNKNLNELFDRVINFFF